MHPFRRPTSSAPRRVATPSARPSSPLLSVALSGVFVLTSALTSTPARAQSMGTPWPSGLSAADPATAATPLAPAVSAPPTTTAPTAPDDLAQARTVWQRANQRVAEFPRGHMDVLRWEDQQRPAAMTPTPGAITPLTLTDALRLSLRQRTDLFIQPNMNELERGETQRAYIDHVLQLQKAFTQATSTGHSLQLMAEVLHAANVGVELGERMVQAGNWSLAKLLREQQVQAQAWQSWAQAQQADAAARERLAQLMGEWAAQAPEHLKAQLADALPALPPHPTNGQGPASSEVEAAVLRSDPTLAWQRAHTQRQLDAVGNGQLQAWQRAVAQAVATPDRAALPGGLYTAPSIDNLPLLRDHLLAQAVRAEASLLQRAAKRRAMAREAWANLHTQHARALHAQNTVVNLSSQLTQETVLRYNGMLQSTWDLLASARQRLLTLNAAAQARRDFWLAQADWQALLAGGDYTSSATVDAGSDTAATTPPGH